MIDPPAVCNLAAAFHAVTRSWTPRIIASLNDQEVKIARLEGEFCWHRHEEGDELFFVLEGDLEIRFRRGVVRLGPGEMVVVPRGVEHLPIAHGPVRVVLIEPEGTRNTGDVENAFTVEPERG